MLIRGKVFSPGGKPMEGVCVKAVSTELAEGNYRGPSNCTDENGEFEIAEVYPGNYIIVVNDEGKITSKEPFGTLFYPGVTERNKAGVVSIEVGKFVDGINIRVPKTEKLIEISGRLLYSDGQPVAKETVKFSPIGYSEKLDAELRTETDGQGYFTIKILKGFPGNLFGSMSTYIGKFQLPGD